MVAIAIPRETVNDESVRVVAWHVPHGAVVEKEQLICEIETSKAVMEVFAPEAGMVEYWAAVGDEVPVGTPIAHILSEAEQQERTATANAVPSTEHTGTPSAASSELPPPRFTPAALRVAAGLGIDLTTFASGTLVRSSDVLSKAGMPARQDHTDTEPAPPKSGKSSGRDMYAEHSAVPGVGVTWAVLPRSKTVEARILSTGQARSIQSSVTAKCCVAGLHARLRTFGLPLIGLDALLVFEAAKLLEQYPAFNAVHDHGRIGYYNEVNIGWAIDGGEGLLVPVIKQAARKTFREIASAVTQFAKSYANGLLKPGDFAGGTFTVSNLSATGVAFFQPLISQGQGAILGIGSESIGEAEECLYLTLAFDHQLSDGRAAASFVRQLSEQLKRCDI
ncbi:MAG TPA: 2-oxo acid dehydrogenase subunit E2 [Bryobacteraceae bacterium]|nr:2-oxo acid dehydrogenase subunit E2 [Bryobacteraceae bacterium]